MRDPHHNPPTSPNKPTATQEPALTDRTVIEASGLREPTTTEAPPGRLRNSMLHAPIIHSSDGHSLALSPRQASEGPRTTRRCSFDRYTRRTKIAATPLPSSKPPILIDTLFGSLVHVTLLHARRRRAPRFFPLPPPPPLLPGISQHPCRDIFPVTPIPSTKLPKYLGTFSHPGKEVNPPQSLNSNFGLANLTRPASRNGRSAGPGWGGRGG